MILWTTSKQPITSGTNTSHEVTAVLEYDFFDSDHFITIDIVEINEAHHTVLVAISNQGRIALDTFDLLEDSFGKRYFQFGLYQNKIHIDDFEEV